MTKLLFYLLVIFIVNIKIGFCQENSSKELNNYTKIEWWNPIIKNHGFTVKDYKVYDNVFIMGNEKTFSDSLVIYKDAIVLENNDSQYTIYNASEVTYDVRSKVVKLLNCSYKIYIKIFVMKELGVSEMCKSTQIETHEKVDIMEIDFRNNTSSIIHIRK